MVTVFIDVFKFTVNVRDHSIMTEDGRRRRRRRSYHLQVAPEPMDQHGSTGSGEVQFEAYFSLNMCLWDVNKVRNTIKSV